MAAQRPAGDEAVDRLLGNLLRAGVILSAAVTAIGGALFLVRYGAAPADYRVFAGEPEDLRSLRGIIAGAITLRPRSLIQLGLLLLIATPIARVAFSLVVFVRQRDRTYVLVTTIVLALLLFSLFLGGHA